MTNGQHQPKAKKFGRKVWKVDPPGSTTDRFPFVPARVDWGYYPLLPYI